MHSLVEVSSEGQWLALARTRFEALICLSCDDSFRLQSVLTASAR